MKATHMPASPLLTLGCFGTALANYKDAYVSCDGLRRSSLFSLLTILSYITDTTLRDIPSLPSSLRANVDICLRINILIWFVACNSALDLPRLSLILQNTILIFGDPAIHHEGIYFKISPTSPLLDHWPHAVAINVDCHLLQQFACPMLSAV